MRKRDGCFCRAKRSDCYTFRWFLKKFFRDGAICSVLRVETDAGQTREERTQNMKTLLIAATVGLGMLAVQANADHSTLSPRGQELFGHKKMAVTGPNSGGAVKPIGPAAKAPTSRENMAKGIAGDEPNLVRSQVYTGRNPFARPVREFEIAPVGQAKECEAGCTKDCCAKK